MKRLAPVLASAVLLAARAAAADPVPPNLAVYGDTGVALGSTSLFKGKVSGAVHDPKQDLIWFLTDGTLEVIDLRDPAHAPVVIAKHVPSEGFSITGLSEVFFDTDYIGVYVHFDFGAKPTAVGEDGAYAGVDSESDDKIKKKAKKISIVGKKWLAAQQGRKANTVPPDRAAPPKVTLPNGIGQCDDTTLCGDASWLGTAPYQVIVVNQSCGDACHVECALYDPAKKAYASPLADGGWAALTDKTDLGACNGFLVEPGNARYAGGNKVCTLGAKMACTDLGAWTAFDWITPPKP
jgi:hypothetical protein